MISQLCLPSLDKYFQMCSCLGGPSHERHNSWQGSNVENVYPKKFQDLESQVLNSAIIVKTWGHGIAKTCDISKLGMPSLEKNVWFHNCVCRVLTNISKCVHVLEDQVMKDIIRGKGLMLKLFTPKSFKTWKAKSWIVQSLSRLGDMELQKHVTFQNLGCQVLKKSVWFHKS